MSDIDEPTNVVTEKRRRQLARNKTQRERIKNNRHKLIKELGGQCVNLFKQHDKPYTDIRALQVDHIKGNGRKQRKEMGPKGIKSSYYLKHLDKATSTLQVLCANCNWIKKDANAESAPVLNRRRYIK